jgi:hypothetical protein
MRPLRVPVRRFGFAVLSLAGLAIAAGCQGPDAFYRIMDAGQPGTAGTSSPGAGGTTGAAGNAAGGTGGSVVGVAGAAGSAAGASGRGGAAAGTGGSTTGLAGTGGGSAGAGGIGGAGAGGTTGGRGGTTGGGSAGSTAGGGGVGGGSAGRGGTTGAGGSSGGGAAGTSGRGGATGGGGAGTTGSGGGSAGTGGGTVDPIEVVALCQMGTSAQEIKVTFKVMNPGSVAKQWSDIKVRYYFTPTMMTTPMVNFDYVAVAGRMPTSTATAAYVEIGFATGAGSVPAFDNVTGSGEIQLRIYNYSTTTWNTSQTDDHSYKSCAGVANTGAYAARATMPGYYQGDLAWGAEPTP